MMISAEELLKCQRVFAVRGGIFQSSHSWTAEESVVHNYWKKKWRDARMGLLRIEELLRNVLEQKVCEVKSVQQHVERALEWWEQNQDELLVIPGVKLMDEDHDGDTIMSDAEDSVVDTREDIRASAGKDKASQADSKEEALSRELFPSATSPAPTTPLNKKMANIGLPGAITFSKSPPLQSALRRGTNSPRTDLRVRIDKSVCISPDPKPDLFASPPAPTTRSHSPYATRETSRPPTYYRRKSSSYQPGDWASPEGYTKLNTSYSSKLNKETREWKDGVMEPSKSPGQGWRVVLIC